jgi:hypothetical protein
MKVKAEADSKIFIQSLITYGAVDLVYSFVSLHEIGNIRLEDTDKKENILLFMRGITNGIYVSKNLEPQVLELGKEIMKTGVKYTDASHVACAILCYPLLSLQNANTL